MACAGSSACEPRGQRIPGPGGGPETKEESGIDCKVTGLAGIYTDPRHVVFYIQGVTCVKVELEDELPEQLSRRIQIALEHLIEESGIDGLDAEAELLLPSGDEITDSLLQDIQHEQSVYDAANSFRAIPIEELSSEDLNGLSSTERAAALQLGLGILLNQVEVVAETANIALGDNLAEPRDTGLLTLRPG